MGKKRETFNEAKAREFVRRLPLLVYQADACGLHACARALDEAMNKGGHELAALLGLSKRAPR